MALTKITSADTYNKGVVGLADTPGLGVLEMQQKFDELATDVIIPKFNNLIDELEATTAAGNIGAVSTTHATGANVQAILDAMDTYFENRVDTDYQTLDLKIDGVIGDLADLALTVSDNYNTLDGKIDQNYNTLDGKIDTTKTDLQTSIRNLGDYVNREIARLDRAVQSVIDMVNSELNAFKNEINHKIDNNFYTLSERISSVASTANTALANSQSAVTTANNAEDLAESAQHEALTALQGLQAIMSLLQLLLGHIYMNDENGDRIITESGDRVIVDY